MTSYVRENEAENLQNGDIHLGKIPDTLRSVMAHFFSFFTLFHLNLTYF